MPRAMVMVSLVNAEFWIVTFKSAGGSGAGGVACGAGEGVGAGAGC